jgi:hypothetical protein
MLREGFISFDRCTLTSLRHANATPTDSPTGLRVKMVVATCKTNVCEPVLNSIKMTDKAEQALVPIRLPCVASLYTLDESPSPLRLSPPYPLPFDEMHPSEILTS